MTLTKKLFMINNHQKSWSCYQDFFLLLVLFIYAKKLYNSTNTQFLENFERGFTMGYTVAVVGATGAVGAQNVGRINTSNR